jgi:HTH-type transcriptional regulator/antitoxin HigA
MKTITRTEYKPDYVSPPGETLLETLQALGMSQAELARRTGRPNKTINEIIQGRAAITPETSLQLERVLGIPASFWNKREQQYREFLARQEEKKRLEGWAGWLKKLPVKAMVQKGWIKEHIDARDQVLEVLKFFGVASPEAWTEVWEQRSIGSLQQPLIQRHTEALAVWLREGEREAQQIDCSPYDPRRLRKILEKVQKLNRDVVSVAQLQSDLVPMCASAGVALVLVPTVSQTGICGAARWISTHKAVIEINAEASSNEELWLRCFDKAGQALLHGKKEALLVQSAVEVGKEPEIEIVTKE